MTDFSSTNTTPSQDYGILRPVIKDRDGRTTIPPLTIYKASAGSGKTFTLAVEYIKLLISNPANYRYILAVTFTNKATQEMKQRILSKLYGIAHALPDSDQYMEKVAAAFPATEEKVIRSRAKIALDLLVHDYNHFRIETIDSFFQRVLRNLAHELGLTANLQVMLNDSEVEQQAVDNIINNIGGNDDALLSWIMDFIKERIDDDKNWNVIGQIKEFGMNIFKDFYKDHQADLRAIMDDAEFFKRYNSTLRQMKAKAYKEMADYAQRYNEIAATHGIEDNDFSRKRQNAPGYFEKLGSGDFVDDKIPNSFVKAGLENPENFVKKADLGKPASEAIIKYVAPLANEAETARQKAAITINSVDLTLRNINQLRLLGRIEKEVTRINSDNNDFLLSDTQKLLNNLIDKQDSPFIYEKIGGQLRYIMIDEFQDTSCVQWDNFKVLLDDCLAHHSGSLIVGDVKQSIYRWRNGDWKLLQSLNEARYPDLLRNEPLSVNYRSQRNIVDFNNAFFDAAAKLKADELSTGALTEAIKQEASAITEAYGDVHQDVPNDKPKDGFVGVTLLPHNDYDDMTVATVKDIIQQLLSQKIPQQKIAIIVRRNKQIKLLADYFLHNPVQVNGEPVMLNMVSDEAFRLDASLAVNVIVKAMHLLAHPNDKLAEAFLAKSYQQCMRENDNVEQDYASILLNDDFQQLLPTAFTSNKVGLLSMPLIDLAGTLYNIFHLANLNEGAYVCAFFDQLSTFVKKQMPDIDDFLTEWDNSISGKSIQSDEVNGIRLLTVHKSKGLEFDNLIIPFCDWPDENDRDIVWSQPQCSPYSDLPAVPLNISAKKMRTSIYAEDYESEHIKNAVDNLNIMYVAFTRASHNLFIIGKSERSQFPSKLIYDILSNKDFKIDGVAPTTANDVATGIVGYSYGSLYLGNNQNTVSRTMATDNIFEKRPQGVKVDIESNNQQASFMQSNASEEFMTPDDEMEELQLRKAYIETGLVMHKLFATIHDYTELDKAIDQLEFSGVLYNHPITKEKLKEYIAIEFDNPQVREWFSPKWKVFNECSILSYDEEKCVVTEQRPDRVIYDQNSMKVIDFKTGRQLDKHQDQVRRYVMLLRKMGYSNVSGYLWYIRHNNIIKVEG